jgi:hypothetical protein
MTGLITETCVSIRAYFIQSLALTHTCPGSSGVASGSSALSRRSMVALIMLPAVPPTLERRREALSPAGCEEAAAGEEGAMATPLPTGGADPSAKLCRRGGRGGKSREDAAAVVAVAGGAAPAKLWRREGLAGGGGRDGGAAAASNPYQHLSSTLPSPLSHSGVTRPPTLYPPLKQLTAASSSPQSVRS